MRTIREETMFIRNAEFAKLVNHVQSQQQEIEKLQEMLGILAQSLGEQFEFKVGKGWTLSKVRPEHNQFIDDRRQKARSSHQSS
jgi:hypothetical protein